MNKYFCGKLFVRAGSFFILVSALWPKLRPISENLRQQRRVLKGPYLMNGNAQIPQQVKHEIAPHTHAGF